MVTLAFTEPVRWHEVCISKELLFTTNLYTSKTHNMYESSARAHQQQFEWRSDALGLVPAITTLQWGWTR